MVNPFLFPSSFLPIRVPSVMLPMEPSLSSLSFLLESSVFAVVSAAFAGKVICGRNGTINRKGYIEMDVSFYKEKRVLVTGHTGFKGSWLCRILIKAGAEVTGYSLEPPTDPDLFSLSDQAPQMNSVI